MGTVSGPAGYLCMPKKDTHQHLQRNLEVHVCIH